MSKLYRETKLSTLYLQITSRIRYYTRKVIKFICHKRNLAKRIKK